MKYLAPVLFLLVSFSSQAYVCKTEGLFVGTPQGERNEIELSKALVFSSPSLESFLPWRMKTSWRLKNDPLKNLEANKWVWLSGQGNGFDAECNFDYKGFLTYVHEHRSLPDVLNVSTYLKIKAINDTAAAIASTKISYYQVAFVAEYGMPTAKPWRGNFYVYLHSENGEEEKVLIEENVDVSDQDIVKIGRKIQAYYKGLQMKKKILYLGLCEGGYCE